MVAVLSVDNDRLKVCSGGRTFVADDDFGADKRRAILQETTDGLNGRCQQGIRLFGLLPRDFHQHLRGCSEAGRAAREGFVPELADTTTLMNFHWEYVPLCDADGEIAFGIQNMWFMLPLIRCIPATTYTKGINYTAQQRPLRTFYNIRDLDVALPARPNMSCIFFEPHDDDAEKRKALLGAIKTSEFLWIAAHARPAGITCGGKVFCGAGHIHAFNPVYRARVVLADCCHSAEADPPGCSPSAALAGGFIKKSGSAVYIGNIGQAKYINRGPTKFAAKFAEEFLLNAENNFVQAIKNIRAAQLHDEHNTQVIYVSADWDPGALRCADILIAKKPEPRRGADLPSAAGRGGLRVLAFAYACAIAGMSLAAGYYPGVAVGVAGAAVVLGYCVVRGLRARSVG